MQNWRQITHEAKDVLTVCLAKGIDKALTARLGDEWFADFALADAKEKVNARITKSVQQSVNDLDMQGLLKLLRYRTTLSTHVLTYYGFFDGLDSFAADDQLRQLNMLLDRLINDFRNRIEAHSRAADIERELSGDGAQRIYGYEEAYQDMYKLACIFKGVTDAKGTVYHRRMATLIKKKNRKKKIILSIVAFIVVIGVVLGAWLYSVGPHIKKGAIEVQLIEAYYSGEEIVVECYITNGLDNDVTDFYLRELSVKVNGREVAFAENFDVLKGLVIKSRGFVRTRFTCPKESVLVYGVDLSNAVLDPGFDSRWIDKGR